MKSVFLFLSTSCLLLMATITASAQVASATPTADQVEACMKACAQKGTNCNPQACAKVCASKPQCQPADCAKACQKANGNKTTGSTTSTSTPATLVSNKQEAPASSCCSKATADAASCGSATSTTSKKTSKDN